MRSQLTWPDFNTSPCEVPYQLLVSPHIALPDSAATAVEDSRLVHDSVDKVGPLAARFVAPRSNEHAGAADANGTASSDPAAAQTADNAHSSAPASTAPSTNGTGANTPTAAPSAPDAATGKSAEKEEEGEGEGELPDSNEKSIANTRPPSESGSDGIWSMAKLQAELQRLLGEGCASAYTTAVDDAAVPAATLRPRTAAAADETVTSSGVDASSSQESAQKSAQVWDGPQTFEERGGFDKPDGIQWDLDGLKGKGEPGYTCYTGLFQLTLGTYPCSRQY